MSTRVSLAALATFAFGCASAGGGSDLPPVPVYASTDELPCEYEVIEAVRGSILNPLVEGVPDREEPWYRSARANVLGQAGAEVGADAVIAREIDVTDGGQPRPPLIRFVGDAIRFIRATCSAPR